MANLLADLVRVVFALLGTLVLVFAVQGGTVPVWLLILVVAIFAALGIYLWLSGRSSSGEGAPALAVELQRHREYSVHLQNSLDVLQQILSGEVDAEIPFFIEQALLAPALQIFASKPIANVRLAVLRPDPEEANRWTMSWAAGHSMPGRLKFNQPIADTLVRHAFESGEDQYWDDTEKQTEFRQNPLASHPTRSLVSIPIRRGNEILGVFNAVSSEPQAFDQAEITFLRSLAGVIGVAVGVWLGEI